GQKVSAMVTNVTNPGATVYLVRPDGQTTTGNVSIATGGPFFLNTQTLLESGLYTLWVQHSGANVGSETLQLYSANDVTGTITIDGAPITVTAGVPGQDVRLTFTASAGQRIVAYATNVTYPLAGVHLVKPDGTDQTQFQISNNPAGQTFFMDTQTLATAGTYQL